MTPEPYKYDVAISFLHRDEPLALDISNRLATSLKVFVYSKQQEQLAGTDGLESFRTVFRNQARLVVVLYREGWGRTPWTRVEEGAIQDRFLKEGWDWLLFVMVDPVSMAPKWLPETRIRMSLVDFGVEQTVGAIRLRAQELGGTPRVESAVEKARRMAQASQLNEEIRQRLASHEAITAVDKEFSEVQSNIERLVGEASTEAPGLGIICGSKTHHTVLTKGQVSVAINWHQRYGNTLSDSILTISEFVGRLILPSQAGYAVRPASRLTDHEFHFALTAEQGWCWRAATDDRYYRSGELAEHCFEVMLDLIKRADAGEVTWADTRSTDPLDDDDAYSGY